VDLYFICWGFFFLSPNVDSLSLSFLGSSFYETKNPQPYKKKNQKPTKYIAYTNAKTLLFVSTHDKQLSSYGP